MPLHLMLRISSCPYGHKISQVIPIRYFAAFIVRQTHEISGIIIQKEMVPAVQRKQGAVCNGKGHLSLRSLSL
jgi:hypothetical protein